MEAHIIVATRAIPRILGPHWHSLREKLKRSKRCQVTTTREPSCRYDDELQQTRSLIVWQL